MLDELFGKRTLVVDPGLLERQLETEMTLPRVATHLTSFAAGFDAVLLANPMVSSLVHDQLAYGIAGLYGHMRRVVAHAAEATESQPSRRQIAAETLALMDQITRLAQTPDPADADIRAADCEANAASTIDSILQDAGVIDL